MRAHWKRWLIGGVAVVLAAAVGGPYVYIHFIEGKPPAPLSLTSQPATTAGTGVAASPATDAGVWKVTSGSQAGYRVNEILFGQSTTAVGRTSSITGSVTIAGTAVTTGTFTVDLTTVTSDRSQRDDQFQGRIMDTSTYPTATFAVTQPIQLGQLPASGVTITENATGTLTMHGKSVSVTFPISAQQAGSQIQVSGSIPITFAKWGIPNPTFGPVSTDDHGILEFRLNFAHS